MSRHASATDQLDRRLKARLDALGPAPSAELLHVLLLPDFDADDVEGPLDLRWVGASLTQDGEFRVTISFYDGFRVSALPRVRHGLLRGRGHAFVDLTEFISGVYVRRHGRIVFLYGDFGSSCGLDFPRSCNEHG